MIIGLDLAAAAEVDKACAIKIFFKMFKDTCIVENENFCGDEKN